MTDIEAAFAAFIENYTLAAAQKLEVMLDDAYPSDPLVQECVEVLACYRPEGGHLLFDRGLIDPVMDRLKAHLGFGGA